MRRNFCRAGYYPRSIHVFHETHYSNGSPETPVPLEIRTDFYYRMTTIVTPELKARLEKIRLLVLDVDGTLTDGGIFIDSEGQEFKRFDAHDGHGIKLVIEKTAIEVIILSGRSSGPVAIRAKELGIKTVLEGHFDKVPTLKSFLQERGYNKAQVAIVGDDLSDLALKPMVSATFATANAVQEVLDGVDFVTKRVGGHGAVREVCDILMVAQPPTA
jgi:3-deoxy-D-manno-octulosonate 8-phosphate phosphatase (KDO 8-P phosphatase)